MALSDKKRDEFKALLFCGFLNQIQIARQVEVAQGTVSKLAKRLREHGNVAVKQVRNCGRNPMLSETTKLRLCINCKKSQKNYMLDYVTQAKM